MDDMNDDGPIAVRDFPAGCMKLPRRALENPTRPRPAEVREGDERSSRFMLPNNFNELNSREKFLRRRKLYSRLLRHYQGSGRLIGHRPDLQAMKHMNNQGTSFDYQDLGGVPGVEVGDTFNYRSEIFVVGLHRQVQRGIACIEDRGEKVACSVVVSGGYRDDDDRGETIIYTGQGGKDYKGDKRQLEDQKPTEGNKALICSYRRGTSVRVIRGHDVNNRSGTSGWIKIYSYDGLYRVTSSDFQEGIDGHKVYTFHLKRLDDQPPLDIEKWKSPRSES